MHTLANWKIATLLEIGKELWYNYASFEKITILKKSTTNRVVGVCSINN